MDTLLAWYFSLFLKIVSSKPSNCEPLLFLDQLIQKKLIKDSKLYIFNLLVYNFGSVGSEI
jgi:hypothetical protein